MTEIWHMNMEFMAKGAFIGVLFMSSIVMIGLINVIFYIIAFNKYHCESKYDDPIGNIFRFLMYLFFMWMSPFTIITGWVSKLSEKKEIKDILNNLAKNFFAKGIPLEKLDHMKPEMIFLHYPKMYLLLVIFITSYIILLILEAKFRGWVAKINI